MKRKTSERLARVIRSSSVQDASKSLIHKIGGLDYPSDDIEEDIQVLRIVEHVFKTKTKGLKLQKNDIKSWPKLFNKCEEVFELSKSKLSLYSQVVLYETLAHRYADYYRLCKKYESEFNRCYDFSFFTSDANDFYAHKDASSFWNGTAYVRCKKINKAAPFFARVVKNRFTFKQVRLHQLKVQASFDFFVDYPEYAPDFINEGVALLVKQNTMLKNKFGVGMPKNKIKTYLERWPHG